MIKLMYMVLAIFFLKNARRITTKNENIEGKGILLIAHPDDETMFFSPALLHLKNKIRIECLSDGGYDGLGLLRSLEMEELSEKIGIKSNIGKFQDGMDWETEKICKYLEILYYIEPFDYIMTFDSKGVSGHKNHISCYYATKKFINDHPQILGFYLKSKNIFMKFFIDFKTSNISYSVSLIEFFKPIKMMFCHKSQMVWFRYFYIFLSNFMMFNDFELNTF